MRKFALLAVAALALTLGAVVAAYAALPGIAARLALPSAAELTLLAFTLTNSVRLLAYLPQIWTAAKADPRAAIGISRTTWVLFLISNLATVAYAVVNLQDWTMAAIFIANAVGCILILAAAIWRSRK